MNFKGEGMEEPQKLFRLPGTIEEEELVEENRDAPLNELAGSVDDRRPPPILPEKIYRPESPLLGQRSFVGSLPRNITLLRVSTQSSSIAGGGPGAAAAPQGLGRQDSTRSRYRAGPSRKVRRRAVLKNGDCNVLQSRISKRSLRFLQDIFTTLVDTQWRWTLLCFSLSFVLSWLGFAVIWWLIAFTHGDFEESHLPQNQPETGWTPCVYNINSFTSCFLFSIETQHTIGYGSRSTTEECPEAIFVMCLQSIAGVMIQAFMVGIVFAKMSRPKQRTQTLLFSRHAVICQRDGELCLMFRVGDMRKSHIIGATVRAQIIHSRTTKEGECLGQHQEELAVGTDGHNGDLFFIWPTTIVHKIDADSPFYNMSAEDMLAERFELVVILEGTIESTGQTTQARSSYLPQEILWGHRFEPMVGYSKERQGYEVDYSLFDSTQQVDTPLCSGRELAEFYRVQEELRQGIDGGLRKIPSEPKSAPIVPSQSDGSFPYQGSSKLHIDIPSIDDSPGTILGEEEKERARLAAGSWLDVHPRRTARSEHRHPRAILPEEENRRASCNSLEERVEYLPVREHRRSLRASTENPYNPGDPGDPYGPPYSSETRRVERSQPANPAEPPLSPESGFFEGCRSSSSPETIGSEPLRNSRCPPTVLQRSDSVAESASNSEEPEEPEETDIEPFPTFTNPGKRRFFENVPYTTV